MISNHLLQKMFQACSQMRRNWLYMDINTFISETGEIPRWGETHENYVQRINEQVQKVWNRELVNRVGTYITLTYVEEQVFWSVRRPDGHNYFP